MATPKPPAKNRTRAISSRARRSTIILAAKDLEFDPRLQRYFDGRHSARIQTNWDQRKAGVLTVSKRDDGRFYLIDGMHRKDAGFHIDPMFMFDCIVWEGLTLEDEAEMFLALNKARLGVKQYDLFRLGLLAGHWDDISANDQLVKAGLEFGYTASAIKVGAVAACKRIVAMDKGETELLYDTLIVARNAWGDHAESWDATLLQAIAKLIFRNRSRIELDRLITVLARRRSEQWRAEIRRIKSGGGSASRSLPLINAMIEEYNTRLRSQNRKIR